MNKKKSILITVLILFMSLISVACGPNTDNNINENSNKENNENVENNSSNEENNNMNEQHDNEVVVENDWKIINVNDLGAVGDGVTDDTDAIRDAIRLAQRNNGYSKIVFEEGSYLVNEYDFGTVFEINYLKNVVFQGKGAEKTQIVINNPKAQLFFISNCENVSFEGFSVDWNPLPFTQGTILSIEKETNSFVVELDEGYPLLDEPWIASQDMPSGHGRWGMVFDPEVRALKPGVQDFIEVSYEVEKISEKTYRVTAQNFGTGAVQNDMAVGDRWVEIIRPQIGGVFYYNSSMSSYIDGIEIYSCPSLVYVGRDSSGLEIRNSAIKIKEGTDRLISANGDGWHFQACRGKGPVIENSFIEGICDDGIAINQLPAKILSSSDSSNIVISNEISVRPGDTIEVFNPREGKIVGRSKIKNLLSSTGINYEIELETPIEGIYIDSNQQLTDQVFIPEASGSGFIIRNNTFMTQRRYAIFVQSHDGIIENNYIQDSRAHGIVVHNDAQWPIGIYPDNIIIKGNVVKNVGLSKYYGNFRHGASIIVKTGAYPDKTAVERLATNIIIVDNEVINPPGAGIMVGGADTVLIKNNIIKADADYPPARRTSLLILDNCSNVEITSNVFDDVREDTVYGIEVSSTNEKGNSISIIDNSFNLNDKSTEIWDRR